MWGSDRGRQGSSPPLISSTSLSSFELLERYTANVMSGQPSSMSTIQREQLKKKKRERFVIFLSSEDEDEDEDEDEGDQHEQGGQEAALDALGAEAEAEQRDPSSSREMAEGAGRSELISEMPAEEDPEEAAEAAEGDEGETIQYIFVDVDEAEGEEEDNVEYVFEEVDFVDATEEERRVYARETLRAELLGKERQLRQLLQNKKEKQLRMHLLRQKLVKNKINDVPGREAHPSLQGNAVSPPATSSAPACQPPSLPRPSSAHHTVATAALSDPNDLKTAAAAAPFPASPPPASPDPTRRDVRGAKVLLSGLRKALRPLTHSAPPPLPQACSPASPPLPGPPAEQAQEPEPLASPTHVPPPLRCPEGEEGAIERKVELQPPPPYATSKRDIRRADQRQLPERLWRKAKAEKICISFQRTPPDGCQRAAPHTIKFTKNMEAPSVESLQHVCVGCLQPGHGYFACPFACPQQQQRAQHQHQQQRGVRQGQEVKHAQHVQQQQPVARPNQAKEAKEAPLFPLGQGKVFPPAAHAATKAAVLVTGTTTTTAAAAAAAAAAGGAGAGAGAGIELEWACEVCDMALKHSQVDPHIEGKQHAARLAARASSGDRCLLGGACQQYDCLLLHPAGRVQPCHWAAMLSAGCPDPRCPYLHPSSTASKCSNKARAAPPRQGLDSIFAAVDKETVELSLMAATEGTEGTEWAVGQDAVPTSDSSGGSGGSSQRALTTAKKKARGARAPVKEEGGSGPVAGCPWVKQPFLLGKPIRCLLCRCAVPADRRSKKSQKGKPTNASHLAGKRHRQNLIEHTCGPSCRGAAAGAAAAQQPHPTQPPVPALAADKHDENLLLHPSNRQNANEGTSSAKRRRRK